MVSKHSAAGAVAAALIAAPHPLAAHAADSSYPQRPIRLIIAQAPGGNADIVGRAYALRMSEGLGQQSVIDNRPGA